MNSAQLTELKSISDTLSSTGIAPSQFPVIAENNKVLADKGMVNDAGVVNTDLITTLVANTAALNQAGIAPDMIPFAGDTLGQLALLKITNQDQVHELVSALLEATNAIPAPEATA